MKPGLSQVGTLLGVQVIQSGGRSMRRRSWYGDDSASAVN